MSLVEMTLFGDNDKVAKSINILKTFEPTTEPYRLAFSGGKDSVCILELAKMAGVKYEAVYNVTSVDPPELVRFIRKEYPEVRFEIPHDKDGKPITMWNLIPKRKMPPTRLVRYCCQELKESSGKCHIVVTGVRKAESTNRKNNQGLVTIADKKAKKSIDGNVTRQGGVILNLDNADSRRVVEQCYRTMKTLVNPIIEWTDDDVWEFIRQRNIPYCELYDEGEKRLGCIGCPMGGTKQMLKQFDRYPKYKENYLRAFERMLKTGQHKKYKTAQECFDRWVFGADNEDENELKLFEEE